MTESEKIYFEKYKQTKDVQESDCHIGGHNCHTCAHCRSYDSNFNHFDNAYCTCAKKD